MNRESAAHEPGTFTVAVEPPCNAAIRLTVRGEIDMATADHLQHAITMAAAREGVRTVSVDLSQVSFCDAHGLGVLAEQHSRLQAHGQRLVISEARRRLMRLLEILELAHLLDSSHDQPPTTGNGATVD